MNRRTYGLLEIERDCWLDGRVFRPGNTIDLDAERYPQRPGRRWVDRPQAVLGTANANLR